MRGMFGFGSSLGLPTRGITPAQPIPMGGLSPVPQEEATQGSQMMGLLGMLAQGMGGRGGQGGMGGLLGMTGQGGGMPALDPSKPAGAGGYGAARGFDGSVNWLPFGTSLKDYLGVQGLARYGAPAAGLPVRGLGGRLGGGI